MSDYRTDSYQEMKALLQDRLDSIVELDADEEESGASKWGRRAAKGALAAGIATGAGVLAYKKSPKFAAAVNKGAMKSRMFARNTRRRSAVGFTRAKRKVSGWMQGSSAQ